MPRIRVAVLVGLVLASLARAQVPGENGELPKPTPVAPQEVQTTPAAQPETSSSGSLIVLTEPSTSAWRFWVKADFALAWVKEKPLPLLVTSNPQTTPQLAAGVIGQPGTSVLIGNTPITQDARLMGKLDFGWWLGEERRFGLDGGFFLVESKGRDFGVSSDSSTIIARPFKDANTGQQSSVLVAFPGISSGSVTTNANMETFWGLNFDLREVVVNESWFRMESLIGYRYLRFGESLNMRQNLNAIGGAFIPGTNILSTDAFQTNNKFHGCEFGFETSINGERWSFDLLTKLAVGNIRRESSISGTTLTTIPGVSTFGSVGGVYALASNIGNHFEDAWVVAPEIGFNIGYQLSPNVRLRAGYTFLFLQGVARAADQIDFTLNPNLFPPAVGGGAGRPAPNIVKSDIWVQSINLGVEFRY